MHEAGCEAGARDWLGDSEQQQRKPMVSALEGSRITGLVFSYGTVGVGVCRYAGMQACRYAGLQRSWADASSTASPTSPTSRNSSSSSSINYHHRCHTPGLPAAAPAVSALQALAIIRRL